MIGGYEDGEELREAHVGKGKGRGGERMGRTEGGTCREGQGERRREDGEN